jgi:hypothetical protein
MAMASRASGTPVANAPGNAYDLIQSETGGGQAGYDAVMAAAGTGGTPAAAPAAGGMGATGQGAGAGGTATTPTAPNRLGAEQFNRWQTGAYREARGKAPLTAAQRAYRGSLNIGQVNRRGAAPGAMGLNANQKALRAAAKMPGV